MVLKIIMDLLLMMKEEIRIKKVIIIIFVLLIQACSTIKEDNFCLPKMVYEASKDTLVEGEFYTAKIHLSDTSFLYLHGGEKSGRVEPIITVNGNKLNAKNGIGEFEFECKKFNNDLEVSKQNIECSITFPYQKGGGGEMTHTRIIYYWVKSKPSIVY